MVIKFKPRPTFGDVKVRSFFALWPRWDPSSSYLHWLEHITVTYHYGGGYWWIRAIERTKERKLDLW